MISFTYAVKFNSFLNGVVFIFHQNLSFCKGQVAAI